MSDQLPEFALPPTTGEYLTLKGWGSNYVLPTLPATKNATDTQNITATPSILQGVMDWLKNSGFSDTIDPKTKLKTQGWGGTLFNGIDSVAGAWNGMRQLDLAEQSLDFQKEAFNRNFANQQSEYNRRLEDRQRARLSANPRAESLDAYMNKHRI